MILSVPNLCGGTSRRFFIAVFATLLLATLSAYSSGLNNGFLLDDEVLIVNNPYIKNPALWGRIFTTGIFHFRSRSPAESCEYYRPLQSLSFAFDYAVWGLNPLGYRVTNIILHACNSFLIFALIFLLLKDPVISFIASVLFSVHPIHAALVTFVSGRSNLLETFFMLSSLLALILFLQKRGRIYFFLSPALFAFALVSREGALLLPLFAVFILFFLRAGRKEFVSCLIPFLSVSAIYIILRRNFFPCDKLGLGLFLSFENILYFLKSLYSYIAQLIMPCGLRPVIFARFPLSMMLLGALSVIFIVHAIARVLLRDRPAILSVFLFLSGMLPLIALKDNVRYFGCILSEHYVYMASAGFFAYLASIFRHKDNRINAFSAAVFLLVFSSYALINFFVNFRYSENRAFYEYVLSVNPENIFVRVNLGNSYLENRMYLQAQKEAEAVLLAEPRAWDAYLLLGNIWKERNNTAEAEKYYRKSLEYNPGSAEALNNLGLIYLRQGAKDEALEFFGEAYKRDPEFIVAARNLADLLFERGRLDEAKDIYEKILRYNLKAADVYVRIGVIDARDGNNEAAEINLKKALKVDSASFDALNNLGALYANRGNYREAVLYWEKALRVKPGNAQVRKNLDYLKEALNKK